MKDLMWKIKKLLGSRRFHALFGMAISVILIIVIIFSVEWSAVLLHLGRIHLWAFIPVTAVLLLGFAIRTVRWRYLLPPGERVSFKRLFDAIMVGVFATYVLPLRAGEFVRPFYLSRYSRYGFATGFVSVVVERFFDLAMVLGAFGVMIFYVPTLPDWVGKGAQIFFIMALAILVLLVLGAFLPAQLRRCYAFLGGFLPGNLRSFGQKLLDECLDGVVVLKSGSNLFKVVGLSLLLWLECFFTHWVFFFFFGIYNADPWLAVALAVIIALAVAAPSAPAFIGVYQVACLAGFALFGLDKELGLAFSIVTHVYQYLLVVVYGFYVLLRDNLRLSDLRGAAGAPE